jgi:glycosyltransferase involved in cell wall biosynthesis
MLSICFLDPKGWDYNVDIPFLRPLGGSESALCYLAAELAKLGHDITLLTGTTKPDRILGVNCLNQSLVGTEFFSQRKFNAVIVLNNAGMSSLKWNLPSSTKLILWTGHAVDQPAMQVLSRRNTRKKWDYIACVSDWQKQSVINAFHTDDSSVHVLKNAIAPAFENLFRSREDLVAQKSDGLRLAYTSTPFRGLDLLLRIFPSVRRSHPHATLHIYSSMNIYQEAFDTSDASDPYAHLYESARRTAGVEYVGPVPQADLSAALSRCHVLSYPNTFPETSCIAVMEALAAGLLVVTSDLGALAETTQGFARLVPYQPGNLDYYVQGYTTALAESLESGAAADRLYEQVSHMNAHYTWKRRAADWVEFLRL